MKKNKPDSRWESMLLKIAEAAATTDCEIRFMIAMRDQHEYMSLYKNNFTGYHLIEDKVIERATGAAAKADYDLFFWYLGNDVPLSKLNTHVSITDAALNGGCMEWLWFPIKKGADCRPDTREVLRTNHQYRFYQLGIPWRNDFDEDAENADGAEDVENGADGGDFDGYDEDDYGYTTHGKCAQPTLIVFIIRRFTLMLPLRT